jgi:hypothetical protein
MTGSVSDYPKQRVRHLRFESVWVEDPPILFELPVPGEEIVWRGMYALIDEYIECLLELWYYRRLGERIDLQAFQPVWSASGFTGPAWGSSGII